MASTKLFVGGISFQSTEDSLRDFFSQYGEVVSAKIITDRDTGRSRGFGFVEFADEAAATAALAADGAELDGRTIRVTEAKPQEPRAPRDNGGGRW